MRALFLTCHLPYPPVSGGRLREHELLRRVGRDCEVHVCAISKTFAQDCAAAGALDGAVFEARAGRAEVPAQLAVTRAPKRPGTCASSRRTWTSSTWRASTSFSTCPSRARRPLEALCRGKAIVSTSIGAQGLGDGALIVADDAETFARAAAELLVDARARGALEPTRARLRGHPPDLGRRCGRTA
jgi:hypothetical protein